MTRVMSILAVLFCCVTTRQLDAQQRKPQVISMPPGTGMQPIPRRMVYFIFFRNVSNFAHQAAAINAAAPAQVQNTFAQEIGLTSDENSILTNAADDCLSHVGKQDAEAGQLIDQIHRQTPGGKLAPGQSIPQLPPALVNMQANRDRLMDACVVNLQSEIGAGFSKVDAYVTKILGSQVSVKTLPIPFTKATATGGKTK